MCVMVLTLAMGALAQSSETAADPHSVPIVDAGLGSCSADFNIHDTTDKPVYAAKIHVRINYRRFHRLDMEVGTNIDGKARFIGLPDKLKDGLFFEASEGDRTGNAFDDPSKTCKAQFTVTLRKPLQ